VRARGGGGLREDREAGRARTIRGHLGDDRRGRAEQLDEQRDGVAALLARALEHAREDFLAWAPRRVRLPPQTLRVTTAGRIACSARGFVAGTSGWRRKVNTASSSCSRSRCLMSLAFSASLGCQARRRSRRARSRPTATRRPCSESSSSSRRARSANAASRMRPLASSSRSAAAPSRRTIACPRRSSSPARCRRAWARSRRSSARSRNPTRRQPSFCGCMPSAPGLRPLGVRGAGAGVVHRFDLGVGPGFEHLDGDEHDVAAHGATVGAAQSLAAPARLQQRVEAQHEPALYGAHPRLHRLELVGDAPVVTRRLVLPHPDLLAQPPHAGGEAVEGLLLPRERPPPRGTATRVEL